jgi:hypothetical protein
MLPRGIGPEIRYTGRDITRRSEPSDFSVSISLLCPAVPRSKAMIQLGPSSPYFLGEGVENGLRAQY